MLTWAKVGPLRHISKKEIDATTCSIIGTETCGFMNKLFKYKK